MHIKLNHALFKNKEVVESPSLDIFKKCLDAILCHGLWDGPD